MLLFLLLPPTALFLFDVWLPPLILVDPFLGATARFPLVVALYVSSLLIALFAATLASFSGAPLLVGQLLLLSSALALDSVLLAFEPGLPCFLSSVRFHRQPSIVAAGIQLVAPGTQLLTAKGFP